MYNFTDLIARSYLKYTKEKDDNIAVYFFQQYHLINYEGKFIFPENLFYTDLIKKLDGFIKNTIHNTHFTRRDLYSDTGIMDNEVFEKIQKFGLIEYQRVIEAEVFEEFQKKRLLEHQNLIDDSGVDYIVKCVNYEESTNAKELEEAFDYGLDLKDPVKIITPSVTIQAEKLVLRKSKLEHLKTEAIRARDTENINDLNKSLLTENNSFNNSTSEIRMKVKKAFKFTLEIGNKKKQILSDEDNLRLVEWVTFYFENKYELPPVDTPISELNIGITYIRFAFKELMDEMYTEYLRPKSFYTLVALCFKDLKNDTISDIQQTSKPIRWEKLNS